MKKILQLIIIAAAGLSLHSCYYDDVVPNLEPPVVIDPGTVITWKADIAPMLTPTCTACHNPGAVDLRDSQQAYDNLINNAKHYVVKGNSGSSLLYNKVAGGTHYASLNATQLATLKAWIDSNAKYQ